MRRRERQLIRKGVGSTVDSISADVRLPHASGGGKSQSQVGSEPTLRVELTSDLHPGDYASARIRNTNKWANANLIGLPKKVIQDRDAAEQLIPGGTLQIHDIDGICFALSGEWLEVKWRNDIGYFVPTSPHGLTRLARAVGAVSANSEGTFQVLKRTVANSLQVATTVKALTDFGVAAVTGCDNAEEVQITYVADREVTANATLSSGTGAWHVIKGAAGAPAATAKIVKLSQIIRPAYETEDGGSYTHFAPVANAASYSHDDVTGELTLNEDSLSVVNLAQRSYGTSGAARAEYNLAVPIDGGKRVLIPMANDPYTPMVSLEYRNKLSNGYVLEATAEYSNVSIWLQQDHFNPLSFGKVTPADTDEAFPLYARAHETGLYICKPGKYLIMAAVTFTMGSLSTSYGEAKVLTTGGASAGTAHTHDYEADGPWGQFGMQVRANLIDDATPDLSPFYPDAFAHVNLPVMYATETSGSLELLTSFVIAPSPGFIARYNLMAAFQAWNFDESGDTPKVRVTGGYIRAIPISDYIHGQSIPTDQLHTKQFNPYASGSFVWHQGFSAPPAWDKDGAAV